MASPNDVPRVAEPIAGSGGFVTRAWLDFFLKLASTESQADMAALYAALAARVAELEENEGFTFQIIGQGAVSVNGTPQPGGFVVISLDNDVDNPGNTMYYGTGPTGERGWFPVSGTMLVEAGQLTKTVASNGVTTFGLADVADSGAGVLLATTFDAKGRKIGSRAATITGTANQINVANGTAAAGLPTLSLAAPVIASLAKADSAVQSVVAGAGITVDNTNPQNPVVSATGATPAHNSLSGIQGGTSGQYYHLTLDQLAYVDSAPSIYGFKNKIINGNFDFWQRALSAPAASAGRFVADRWLTNASGTTVAPAVQSFTVGQTAVPGEPAFFHRATVVSSAGASNFAYMAQSIESVRTFAGQTATISFMAKADASKPMSIEFLQSFGVGGSPSSSVAAIGVTKFNLTTAWQRFTATVSIPSISGKTIGTTNDGLLAVNFWLDAGSSFNARTATLGQQSGVFDISQVQVEYGSTASLFEQRPLAIELLLCQRFYEKSYDTNVVPLSVNGLGREILGTAAGTGLVNAGAIRWKVTKRGTPSVTTYSINVPATGVVEQDNGTTVAAVVNFLGTTGAQVNWTNGAGRWGAFFQWSADAEL